MNLKKENKGDKHGKKEKKAMFAFAIGNDSHQPAKRVALVDANQLGSHLSILASVAVTR